MITLSNGLPSTLGNYRDLCEQHGLLKAMAYFERLIVESPAGRDEEVTLDESQMLHVVGREQRGEKQDLVDLTAKALDDAVKNNLI